MISIVSTNSDVSLAYPKVTIMIPTYCQANYIEQAIASALEQRYPNFEVVVCDDASSDETIERIARFADPRLVVVRNEKNIGRVANYRKILYEIATGDYVVNLDGDDYFLDPDFVSIAMRFFAADADCVMVMAKAAKSDHVRGGFGVTYGERHYKGLDYVKKIPNVVFSVLHMATLYDRKKALQLNFYRSDVLSSDWESLYRLALHGNVVCIDRCIGVWRQHGKNTSAIANGKQLLKNLEIWSSVFLAARDAGMVKIMAEYMRTRCESHYFSAACVKLSAGGVAKVLSLLRQAVCQFGFRALAWALYPQTLIRVIASMVGYYRWRYSRQAKEI